MDEKNKVLIVDDEVSMTDLLHEILTTAGFDTEVLNDPGQAVNLLNENNYDVMLTDLRMPKINGIDLLKQALSIHPDLIVIVLTGYGSIESVVEAMKYGAVGYISKPFRPKNIINTITKELEARDIKKQNVQLKRMLTIYEFSESISSTLKFEEIAETIENACFSLLPAQQVMVMLKKNPQDKSFNIIHSKNQQGELVTSISKEVKEFVNEFFDNIEPNKVKQLDEMTLLALSMTRKKYLTGIFVAVLFPDFQIQKEDLQTLQILANRVSISVENHWLIQSLKSSLNTIHSQQQRVLDLERLSTIGEMASTITHEISNPLGAMQMAMEYIKSLSPDQDPEQLNTALHSIDLGLQKILNIVNNLRKISRGKDPSLSFVTIEEILVNTESFMDFLLKKNKINLVKNIDPNLPYIKVDQSQLQQVFKNLILNSIDALPDGGEIEIQVHWDQDQKLMIINFKDNGVGISPDNINKIFKPFFSDKIGQKQGSGLGLSVVKKIIERHQGEIEVSSKPGQGTTFTIGIPKEPQSPN